MIQATMVGTLKTRSAPQRSSDALVGSSNEPRQMQGVQNEKQIYKATDSYCIGRRVIAAAVEGDPDTYSEAFLGRPNADYCRWILGKDKWGGAIELSILSRCAKCPHAVSTCFINRCV